MITRRTLVQTALATPFISMVPKMAGAMDWPTAGPIRLVVASGAGGNADTVARLVAAELENTLGQTFVVENLSSASGMQGTEAVSNADPDGYTLLVGTSSQLVHNIALFEPLPVDITNTLRGVAMMNEVPMVMLVNNDEESENLEQFIEKISANPDAYQYGSGPAGTTTHITGALFLDRLGLDITHVPYPRSGEALRDTIAGRLTFQFIPALSGVPQIRDGAVKSLGVAAPERLAAMPDLPTISEAGLDGFVSQTWNSFAAPAGTPDNIVNQLNEAVNAIVQSDAVKSQLTDLGALVPAAMTPAEVDAYYTAQRETWIPVVRETGVRRNAG
ncbi:MAG: tripartite tricarboxylate transporter substrate binding protein [Pseudomonadota bacterium]